jgi:hypothetical protein
MASSNTTPSVSSKSPQNTNTKPAEPPKAVDAKPVETPQASEPVQAEAPQAQAPTPAAKSSDKTIISLSVPERLARQVRLLSKLEGKSISAIFLDAVASDIPSRLKVALASIVEE